MKKTKMSKKDMSAFNETMNYVRGWCSEHQWEIGVAEMAIGASIIALGVNTGTIEMGKDLVGNAFGKDGLGAELTGAGGGAVLGGFGAGALKVAALGGTILSSIGIACGGGAVAIPAALVLGGGSFIMGGLGYASADILESFLNSPVDPKAFFKGCSLLAVGTALLIDGARRLVKDKRVLRSLSTFKDGVITFAKVSMKVVARSIKDLKRLSEHLLPKNTVDAAGTIGTGAAIAAGGGAIGASVAASSVSVLGSQALGGVALSLGLVSAPVLPVVLGSAAGFAVGYAGWRACRTGYRRAFCTSK